MRERDAQTAMIFRSAVDGWYYAVIVVAAVVAAIAVVPLLWTGQALHIIVAVGTLLLAIGLPLWLLYSTSYRVDSKSLRVRSGPFRWTIPLDEIHDVRASRSPLSSPALSLDRIQIRYGRGKSMLLSPRDREKFLAAIGHRIDRA